MNKNTEILKFVNVFTSSPSKKDLPRERTYSFAKKISILIDHIKLKISLKQSLINFGY